MESAIGLVAPFVIYFVAEEVHGSGVIAVVVAALILGQRSTHAGYATRLQDMAVWQAVQLMLESFAFLLIGLQLPKVVGELEGIPRSVIVGRRRSPCSATVIVVRIVWVYVFAYLLPGCCRRGSVSASRRRRPRRCSSSRGRACAAWCRWPPRSACR